MKLRIYGKPKPKKRWKPTGKKGGGFNPSKESEGYFRARVAWTLYDFGLQRIQSPIKEPVGLMLTFAFPIPKSEQKKIKPGDLRPKTPDDDNLEKFFMDALKGFFWVDDRQVCFKICRKIYDKEGYTEFEILRGEELFNKVRSCYDTEKQEATEGENNRGKDKSDSLGKAAHITGSG